VSVNVMKCSWMKCGEVLQCSDGPSNKASNSIRRRIENLTLLLLYYLGSFFFLSMFVWLCSCLVL
jgi:hypothetical protein